MSKLRFYLDENVTNEIADGLHTMGIDALTTPQAGNMALDDPGQLAFAANEGQGLVTQDDDYLVLNSQGTSHAGIAYWKPQTRGTKYILRTAVTQITLNLCSDSGLKPTVFKLKVRNISYENSKFYLTPILLKKCITALLLCSFLHHQKGYDTPCPPNKRSKLSLPAPAA